MMDDFGIPGRSDLLDDFMDTQVIAGLLLEDFQSFMHNPAALLGYNPFDF